MVDNVKSKPSEMPGLPEGFRDKAAIVSEILAQKSLEPGLYLRTIDGEIIPAFFSEAFPEKLIPSHCKTEFSWPVMDFVYDSRLQAVFAKHGRYVQHFAKQHWEKSDYYETQYFLDANHEFLVQGGRSRISVTNGEKKEKERIFVESVMSDGGQLNATSKSYHKILLISLSALALSEGIYQHFKTEFRSITLQSIKTGKKLSPEDKWNALKKPISSPLNLGAMTLFTASLRLDGNSSNREYGHLSLPHWEHAQ